MYVCAPVWVSACTHVCEGPYRCQKRPLDPSELWLYTFGSYLMWLQGPELCLRDLASVHNSEPYFQPQYSPFKREIHLKINI